MDTILFDLEQGVATVTLNRPEKLNAFGGTMREDLIEILERAAEDSDVRCVVITGAGRGFCSGGDVEAMSRMQKGKDAAGFLALLDAGAGIVSTIRSMPQLVIASVNGVAAGAGCNLALACDYRIASTEAKLGQTFVKIGLHPDWGGSWMLPRLIGRSRAMELMATGRMVGAEEAVAIGMVDRVVPAGDLDQQTRALARSVASGPPIPLRDLKRNLDASERNDLEQQLSLERESQARAFASGDAAEGIAAFLEKRPPRFQGR